MIAWIENSIFFSPETMTAIYILDWNSFFSPVIKAANYDIVDWKFYLV